MRRDALLLLALVFAIVAMAVLAWSQRSAPSDPQQQPRVSTEACSGARNPEGPCNSAPGKGCCGSYDAAIVNELYAGLHACQLRTDDLKLALETLIREAPRAWNREALPVISAEGWTPWPRIGAGRVDVRAKNWDGIEAHR